MAEKMRYYTLLLVVGLLAGCGREDQPQPVVAAKSEETQQNQTNTANQESEKQNKLRTLTDFEKCTTNFLAAYQVVVSAKEGLSKAQWKWIKEKEVVPIARNSPAPEYLKEAERKLEEASSDCAQAAGEFQGSLTIVRFWFRDDKESLETINKWADKLDPMIKNYMKRPS